MINRIEEQIKALEVKLLHANLKTNPSLLDKLLAEDFEEIGSTGYASSRAEVIEWLKSNDDHWLLTNFRVKVLSSELVLAIYHAQKITSLNNETKGSLRSSIWKRHGDSWQMIFHQGSKISE